MTTLLPYDAKGECMEHKCHYTTEEIDGQEYWIGTCEEYPDVKVIEDSFVEALGALEDVIRTLDEWDDEEDQRLPPVLDPERPRNGLDDLVPRI